MSSPPTENRTPRLQCPRCTQPFRIPPDKVGALLRCKHCNLHFRLTRDAAGGYVMHPEAVGATVTPAVPPTLAAGRTRNFPAHVPPHGAPPARRGQVGRAARRAAGRASVAGHRRYDFGKADRSRPTETRTRRPRSSNPSPACRSP